MTALIALAAGIGLAVSQWQGVKRQSPRPLPLPATTEERVAGRVDGRAVAQAPGTSRDVANPDSNRWVDEVKGVDVTGLDGGRREVFMRFANAERCTCGCGYTLAACRTHDPTCEVSLPLAVALLDSIRTSGAAVDRRRDRRLP